MSKKTIETNPIFAGDEVLQEVWRIKDEIAAKYGGDLDRFFEDLRDAQKASGRKVIDFSKD
jgi:hypothetical protein